MMRSLLPALIALFASAALPAAYGAPGEPVAPQNEKSPEMIKKAAEAARKIRDPFKRPEILRAQQEAKSDLERYSIDQFRMTGVLLGERMRAMVRAPNGKSYFLQENMKIGVRKGVVRRITADTIVVRERVVNILGEEEDVNVEIRMGGDNPQAQGSAGG
jgi:Tfp pilus assembly protein PilP